MNCDHCSSSTLELARKLTACTKDCVAFLDGHYLIAAERICPKCHKRCRRVYVNKTIIWRCDRRQIVVEQDRKIYSRCNFKESAFKGTWFSQIKISIDKCLMIPVMYLDDKFNFKQTLTFLNISVKTLTDWISFIKEVITTHMISISTIIGGPGCVVNIYEGKFGSRKYNLNASSTDSWIFAAIQQETGDCFLAEVEDRSEFGQLAIIRERIRPGTIMNCDNWHSYSYLNEGGHSFSSSVPRRDGLAAEGKGKKREGSTEKCRYNSHSHSLIHKLMFCKKYSDSKVRLHMFWTTVSMMRIE